MFVIPNKTIQEEIPLPVYIFIYNVSFRLTAYTKPMYGATEIMIAATTNIGIKVFSIVFRYIG